MFLSGHEGMPCGSSWQWECVRPVVCCICCVCCCISLYYATLAGHEIYREGLVQLPIGFKTLPTGASCFNLENLIGSQCFCACALNLATETVAANR